MRMPGSQGIVMAAGKGSRMYPLTEEHGKAFLPLGDKTIMQHIVEKMVKLGFSRIIVAVLKRDETIARECLTAATEPAISFLTFEKSIGTAKTLQTAAHLLGESFLVHYDDVISNVNLRDMMVFHRKSSSIATIALVTGQKLDYGIVTIDSSMRVVSFREKPPIQGFVNAAIFAFDHRALKYMEETVSIEESISNMIEKGERVYGYPTGAYWHHLENPSDYIKLVRMMSSGELDTLRADATTLGRTGFETHANGA